MSKYTVTALIMVAGAAISAAVTGFSNPGHQIFFAIGGLNAVAIHWWLSR